ncbi:MAG TPA: metallopeptidase family protein [Dissulfurispiraceae bacterium]|nr:metallopeptidase family protein [Dissulfurispiraceae bacterium]
MLIARREFERYVEQALASIPKKYRNLFKNISIIVEDLPSREDAELTGVPKDELLGLFKGAALGEGGGFFDVPIPAPNEIYLYQQNIQSACRTEDELIREIRVTLLHEVGHYFGMTEDDLEEFEKNNQ